MADKRVRRKKPAYAKELTPDWKSGRWKSGKFGRQWYSKHPLTEDGYQSALREFRLYAAEQTQRQEAGDKPNAVQYQTALQNRMQIVEACASFLSRFAEGNPPPTLFEVTIAEADFRSEENTLPHEVLIAKLHGDSEERLRDIAAGHLGRSASREDAISLFTNVSFDQFTEIEWNAEQKHYHQLQVQMAAECSQLRTWFKRKRPPELDRIETLPIMPGITANRWTTKLLAEFGIVQRYTKPVAAELTVSAQVGRYLKTQQERTRPGASKPLSQQRFLLMKGHLNHLTAVLGQRSSAELMAADVSQFANAIGQKVKDKQLSSSTANDILKFGRRFIEWLWQTETLPNLPRNLNQLTYSVTQPAPQTIGKDTISRLLSAASDRTKLFLLPMLNCGMTQKDVSDLRPSEVDWSTGRIKRKRSKRQFDEKAATVDYPLWSETFRLLKAIGRQTGDRVFLSDVGKPLVEKGERTNGSSLNTDLIRQSFLRLCKRKDLILTGVSLKQFRKTAASELDQHPEFSRYAQFFLAHSGETLADRRYVVPSQERFDAAVKWLGEQLIS